MALTDGHEALAQALCRNVLTGENIDKARQLAAYAEAAMAALAQLDEAKLLAGAFRFPLPERASAP
jgi:cytochrome b pre-mRNA-processing protein 3